MSTATLQRPHPSMGGDEVLTTTRCVRRRLDFSRPVERHLVEDCVEIALQAPTGSFSQIARFICVDDPVRRMALAELYRKGWSVYQQTPLYAGSMPFGPALAKSLAKALGSAEYLVEHMHEAPVLVIPCADLTSATGQKFIEAGYTRDAVHPTVLEAAMWGSVMPAAWSFMLAAHTHDLASCWTVVHMFFEKEAADILGVAFDSVVQAAMIPVAHPIGETFHVGPRMSVTEAVHWNTW